MSSHLTLTLHFWIIIICNTGIHEGSSTGEQLYGASGRGDLSKVMELAGDKCTGVNSRINYKNVGDYTPLHIASSKNHVKVVMFLLSCNADLNAQTTIGATPLMAAIQKDSKEVVNVLLAEHPDLDFESSGGETALLLSAAYAHVNVTNLLLDLGANMYVFTNDGATALHYATLFNRKENVRTLLQHGINADIISKTGETAADIAKRKGFTEILQLIQHFNERSNGCYCEPTMPTHVVILLIISLVIVACIIALSLTRACLYFMNKHCKNPSLGQHII